MANKHSALILNLGGAPETWHRVDGLDGLYHPNIPAPLPENLTVEEARKHHADEGHPLSVVQVSDAKLEQGTAAQAEAMNVGRAAAAALRRTAATPEEQERVQDEAAALSSGKEG